jgi:hypothetical protein
MTRCGLLPSARAAAQYSVRQALRTGIECVSSALSTASYETAGIHRHLCRIGCVASRWQRSALRTHSSDRSADGLRGEQSEYQTYVVVFRDAFQKLGWAEGRNIQIDYRWAAFDAKLMERFSKELLTLKPDAILSNNTPFLDKDGKALS